MKKKILKILLFTILIFIVPGFIFIWSGQIGGALNASNSFTFNEQQGREYLNKGTKTTNTKELEFVTSFLYEFNKSVESNDKVQVRKFLTSEANQEYSSTIENQMGGFNEFKYEIFDSRVLGDEYFVILKTRIVKDYLSYTNYPIRYRVIKTNGEYKVAETNLFKNIDVNLADEGSPFFDPPFSPVAYSVAYIIWLVLIGSLYYIVKRSYAGLKINAKS